MNKVLIVTYYFPPSGGSGVQRTLKFVKYLREFGWEPVVLTARDADYPAYDETLRAELPPQIKVYHSKIIEPYKLYRKVTGKSQQEAADIATLTLSARQKQKFSERLSEWLRSSFFVPDARMLWWPFAVPLGKKIIRSQGINLIYSSAPPYTTHLIANSLAHDSGLPWVADFRDSWIGWLSTPQWRPHLIRRMELKMEEAVLKRAGRVLTVSNGVKQDLLGRHQHLNDDRWIVLPNGFDLGDFKNITPAPRDNRVVLTYTGSMYGNRNPEYLVRAIESLLKNDPTLGHKLCVRIVGRIGEPIRQRIHSSPAAALFEIISYVTHRESLSWLLATDIALLIIDDSPTNKGILTGKLFEYIGAQKPVLALAPQGDAADLIRQEGIGTVLPPKNTIALKNYLLSIIKNRPAPFFHSQTGKKFERREQTKVLAEIFNKLQKFS